MDPRNPFGMAAVAWHFAGLEAAGRLPLPLTEKGATLRRGVPLAGAERAESLRRGGDGLVAVFSRPPTGRFEPYDAATEDAAWMAIDIEGARHLRPPGSAVTAYVRVFLDKPGGSGTLFFHDTLALGVDPTGLAIGFLGQQTRDGARFRELPLGTIDRGRWLDLVLRVGDGLLEFFCDGLAIASVAIRDPLRSPFERELLVGGFGGIPGHDAPPTNRLGCARLDALAFWHHRLTDAEVVFLSGLDHLRSASPANPISTALPPTTRSTTRLKTRIWMPAASLRTRCDRSHQDGSRPIYHLTAPIGWIYDPSGAFFDGDRYHVFSYRNIYVLLAFNSHDYYVSDDLVHWRMWPTAPVADDELDSSGICLANHVIDDDGIPTVIYGGWGPDGERGIRARSRDGLISYLDKMSIWSLEGH